MKIILVSLACTMIAGLALGQAQVSDSSSGPRTLVNPGLYKAGTVASFTGTKITLASDLSTHPTKFVVGTNVRFEKASGAAVSPDSIRPGTRVRLGFGPDGRVDRIVLLDPR